MNITILLALLRKEVKLLMRNSLIPRIVIAMPLLVMSVIPLVATFDVKDVGVTVVDNDRSQLSRRLIADMDASEFISVRGIYSTYTDALASIERGEADAIVSMPKDYLKNLTNGQQPQLSLDANGVNAMKGGLATQYAAASIGSTLAAWQQERGISASQTSTPVMNLYNPTLNFRNYMIPALMGVLIIIMCGFLPTLNLVSEKESGTMEAMNVTPVGKLEFVLSKLIPFWIVGLLVVTVGMTVGYFVYGLKPAGSIGTIYLATALFSLVMSGLGVSIANRSSTILQSVFLMFAFIIIFQLMSGLFTPISSMPRWAQCLTYAIPPRYFVDIMRAVYLRGAGVADLWLQFSALTGMAIIFLGIAAATYRKRG